MFINISLSANETKITIGPLDGLEQDQKYLITVTAINSIGATTSHHDESIKCICKYSIIVCMFV